eukprot:366146-Chlamydomonas_euryale.AAC.6
MLDAAVRIAVAAAAVAAAVAEKRGGAVVRLQRPLRKPRTEAAAAHAGSHWHAGRRVLHQASVQRAAARRRSPGGRYRARRPARPQPRGRAFACRALTYGDGRVMRCQLLCSFLERHERVSEVRGNVAALKVEPPACDLGGCAVSRLSHRRVTWAGVGLQY